MKKRQATRDVKRVTKAESLVTGPQLSLFLPAPPSGKVIAFPGRAEAAKSLSQQDALKRILDYAQTFRRG